MSWNCFLISEICACANLEFTFQFRLFAQLSLIQNCKSYSTKEGRGGEGWGVGTDKLVWIRFKTVDNLAFIFIFCYLCAADFNTLPELLEHITSEHSKRVRKPVVKHDELSPYKLVIDIDEKEEGNADSDSNTQDEKIPTNDKNYCVVSIW